MTIRFHAPLTLHFIPSHILHGSLQHLDSAIMLVLLSHIQGGPPLVIQNGNVSTSLHQEGGYVYAPMTFSY